MLHATCLLHAHIVAVMLPPQDAAPVLADYKEHHSDANVRFVLHFLPDKLDEIMAQPGGLEAKLKMTTKITTSACGWAAAGVLRLSGVALNLHRHLHHTQEGTSLGCPLHCIPYKYLPSFAAGQVAHVCVCTPPGAFTAFPGPIPAQAT